eukprot:Phypoly_transcript_07640.p1 GENE.Phypoly_transcript_07640~~Phypoly_transcript_07640.p1  ORF type:complete len:523 (+),score=81.19 Phypoly_transcript_07640:158-1570(+)
MNQQVLKAEYAVRGEIVVKANKYQKSILANPSNHGLPFDEVIFCNIGNPQILGQPALTFFRQVTASCEYPPILDKPGVMPSDVKQRAEKLLTAMGRTTGAYSNSQGVPIVLQDVAKFIEQRDGHHCNPDDIFLTDGASVGVQRMLRLLIKDESDGILIPIPQYPLYSASIDLYGGQRLGYYLDEAEDWKIEVAELERAISEAKKKGINPRALVVINPGNPTGNCMDRKSMEDIVDVCYRHKIVLMADEVYQDNIYQEGHKFVSFKKVLREMAPQYQKLELVSFHSVSKGFYGECGKRGGYLEMVGFKDVVHEQVYKLASIGLCPNLVGQIVVDVMVNPPKPGDESYELYKQERDAILSSLKRRALLLTNALNKLPGMSCNPAEGAMYAFPQITISPSAVAAATAQNRVPDAFYCKTLLDQTGVCVVPGSGFGQKDGTWHFRTTFLPAENQIQNVVDKMAKFHLKFMEQYK